MAHIPICTFANICAHRHSQWKILRIKCKTLKSHTIQNHTEYNSHAYMCMTVFLFRCIVCTIQWNGKYSSMNWPCQLLCQWHTACMIGRWYYLKNLCVWILITYSVTINISVIFFLRILEYKYTINISTGFAIQ